MNVFFSRKLWLVASLLVFSSLALAATEGEVVAPASENVVPMAQSAAPVTELAPEVATEAAAAPESAPAEIAPAEVVGGEIEPASPSSGMTILGENEKSAGAPTAPESAPEARRAKLLERRRQSEERMVNLLREVGGDVPQLRESLRGYLQEEARARRPIRDVGRRLLSALQIGSEEKTVPSESIQKLRETLGLGTPAGNARQTLGGAEETVPDAASSTGLDSQMRVSLRLQKSAASTVAGNAFGFTPPDGLAPAAARVLAAKDDEELRALVAQMRQMQTAERERRLAREAELDAKLHFRDNPRLEAALLLLGIIGDSGYTISIKGLPSARAPQENANNRGMHDVEQPEKVD